MSLKVTALRGALWNFLETIGIQLSGFVMFLVLARLVSPSAFGVVQMATTVIGMLSIFAEQGFSAAIVQARTLTPRMLDTAFWIGVGTSLVMCVALYLTAPWVAEAYRSPELEQILRVVAWLLPLFTLVAVQAALLVRELAFRAQAMRRLFGVLGGGVVGIGMAFNGYGAWSLIGKLAAETVIELIIVWWSSSWRPGFQVHRVEARGLFTFGSNVVLSDVIGFFHRRADDVLIGMFLGPVALGYYAVAYRAVLLVSEVGLRAVQRTSVPLFSRLQEEPARLKNAYYSAIELSSAASCPIFLGLSAVAPELCRVLFGHKWDASVPAMQVLGFVGIPMSIALFTAPVLLSSGRPNWLFRFQAGTAVLNVAVTLVAVRWGITAVAAAFVVRQYLILPISLWVAGRVLPVSATHTLRLIMAPSGVSLLMFLVVNALRSPLSGLREEVSLAVLILAGAVVYAVGMLVFARPTVARALALGGLQFGRRGLERTT